MTFSIDCLVYRKQSQDILNASKTLNQSSVLEPWIEQENGPSLKSGRQAQKEARHQKDKEECLLVEALSLASRGWQLLRERRHRHAGRTPSSDSMPPL